MAIRTSSATQIDRLLVDLASNSQARRDTAVARLTVIGRRAVERIRNLAADPEAPAPARAAAFRALEAIADPRALEPAMRAVFDVDETVALAAIGVARVFLRTPRGVAVIGRLTEIAADQQRAVRRRLAAFEALRTLGPSTLEPLVAALRSDPAKEIAAAADGRAAPGPKAVASRYVTDAAEGRWDGDGGGLRRALRQLPADFPLPTLQRLIGRLSDRERREREPSTAHAEWTTARATAHAALARRGSRLALYDLRETLESADSSLPVEFLTALTAIGDRSCLEAIAAAYAHATGDPRDWWHRHLADAFHAIVSRERMTRRHPTAKKIAARWQGAFHALWP